MSRFIVVVGTLIAIGAGAARAEGVRGDTGDGLCTPPKSVDAGWHAMQAEGVSLRIPKGYTITQSGSDYRVYSAGQRHIGIEWGRGPGEIESGGALNPISECRAIIDGRIVTISLFHWTRIDQAMAPSGDAGTKFLLVARFPSVQGSHAVSVWIFTPFRGDAMQFRSVFWTVVFPVANSEQSVASTPGSSSPSPSLAPAPTGGGVTAAATSTTTVVDAMPVAATAEQSSTASPESTTASLATVTPNSASASASSMPLPPPRCGAPPAGAPVPGAVVDTMLVQMLANGSGPIPQGHGVVALTLDASGTLAGVAVVDSDLPPDAQRQLATIVSSNIKPHPATSTTLYLRVDTGGKALRYTMVSCDH